VASAAYALIGLALILTALAATQPRLDRHFLPSFFLLRTWYVRLETSVRLLLVGVGASLVLARRWIARTIAGQPFGAASIVVAALLALGASEAVLRFVHLRPTEWLLPNEEPRRRVDARLGWVLEPARTGHTWIGGRSIEYAIDANGYRVHRSDEPVDFTRPTMVFAGESVMFGEGLTWDESIPAQVGTTLGIQSANLAVHGYSNDQAYMRLQTELPRFPAPVAVVTVFMTALLGRNLDDDRPHLDPQLTWQPAQPSSRLRSLAGLLVPYRTDGTLERGIRMTVDVFRATIDLARGRGAVPLIVVPQMGPESTQESQLRRRILDEAQLPYVFVEIDPAWHVSWDRHPNARATQRIARAIVDRLRKDLPQLQAPVLSRKPPTISSRTKTCCW